MEITYPLLNNVIVIDNEVIKDNDLKYHSSWDWLMPVVEKIASLDWVWINIIPCALGKFSKESNCYIETGVSSITFSVSKTNMNLLQAIYEAVVEFIKFYNTQKVSIK